MDVRGCYCALAVCHMLNLDKKALAEACGMERYIRACQVSSASATSCNAPGRGIRISAAAEFNAALMVL